MRPTLVLIIMAACLSWPTTVFAEPDKHGTSRQLVPKNAVRDVDHGNGSVKTIPNKNLLGTVTRVTPVSLAPTTLVRHLGIASSSSKPSDMLPSLRALLYASAPVPKTGVKLPAQSTTTVAKTNIKSPTNGKTATTVLIKTKTSTPLPLTSPAMVRAISKTTAQKSTNNAVTVKHLKLPQNSKNPRVQDMGKQDQVNDSVEPPSLVRGPRITSPLIMSTDWLTSLRALLYGSARMKVKPPVPSTTTVSTTIVVEPTTTVDTTTVDTKTVATTTVATTTLGTIAVGTTTVGITAVGTTTVGTTAVGTTTVGTKTVGTKTVGTKTVGTKTVGTKTVGTKTVGTKTVGTTTAGTTTVSTTTGGTTNVGTTTVGTTTVGTTTVDTTTTVGTTTVDTTTTVGTTTAFRTVNAIENATAKKRVESTTALANTVLSTSTPMPLTSPAMAREIANIAAQQSPTKYNDATNLQLSLNATSLASLMQDTNSSFADQVTKQSRLVTILELQLEEEKMRLRELTALQNKQLWLKKRYQKILDSEKDLVQTNIDWLDYKY